MPLESEPQIAQAVPPKDHPITQSTRGRRLKKTSPAKVIETPLSAKGGGRRGRSLSGVERIYVDEWPHARRFFFSNGGLISGETDFATTDEESLRIDRIRYVRCG